MSKNNKEYMGTHVCASEAARRLGISRSTIYEWGRSGCLDGIRVQLGARWLIPIEWIEWVIANGFSGQSSRAPRPRGKKAVGTAEDFGDVK